MSVCAGYRLVKTNSQGTKAEKNVNLSFFAKQ
jgi:hypothetical protein